MSSEVFLKDLAIADVVQRIYESKTSIDRNGDAPKPLIEAKIYTYYIDDTDSFLSSALLRLGPYFKELNNPAIHSGIRSGDQAYIGSVISVGRSLLTFEKGGYDSPYSNIAVSTLRSKGGEQYLTLAAAYEKTLAEIREKRSKRA